MPDQIQSALSIRSDFRFDQVSSRAATTAAVAATPAPSLGPLAAFTGTFTGHGFNTIFRPDSQSTPTPLPGPVTGPEPRDNVLELNLTLETLSFSASLGNVPNRGSGSQPDAFLNGVPYLQSIQDITIPSQPTGIHLEPGLWIIVPSTQIPAEGVTVARMASIPHGTTIVAQGTGTTAAGKPTIPAVDITPFATGAPDTPPNQFKFPSQTATNKQTARIPQDLGSFIAAGTITQAMLDDPNTLLRNHIAAQNIISTTTISIDTSPASPLFGGGADNIAFLVGTSGALTNPAQVGPNSQTLQMTATFWIETVEHTILVPIFRRGQPPMIIRAPAGVPGQPVPHFHVEPPIDILVPRPIKVRSTQIQYSQEVFLNFNTLSWPHVSVATLVPSGAIHVPPSVWT